MRGARREQPVRRGDILIALGNDRKQDGWRLPKVGDRVRRIAARYVGPWELPVLGAVSAPSAVLIRPDGYVAWVGEGTDAGLADALTRWC